MGSSFVLPGTTTTKTYVLVEETITPSSTGTYYFAIRVNATSAPWYLSFDDFSLTEAPDCLAPTALTATNITTTGADLGWTPGGTEPLWNVEVGLPGFTPGTGAAVFSEYFTPDNPLTATPLDPETDYEFYVQAYCNGFENPKVDYFWMAMSTPGALDPLSSGGTANDPGETGLCYQYYDPEEDLPWWNIWFYNDPLDTTRMKKIRMGFWVQPMVAGPSSWINYVINWSTPGWVSPDPPLPAFPMPMDEVFIQRSPLNGPILIAPGVPQWIELLYIIPDYNPEWVSVDIWGENIQILEVSSPPPPGSPLFDYWLPGSPGGIIVHECLPKNHNTSSWSGPKAFQTACDAVTLPLIENFSGVTVPALPDCWSTTALGSTNWATSATANAGGVSPEVKFYWTSPSWTGLSMFISPFINTTGASILSLDFKHSVDWYTGTFNIGVKTTSDGNTWNTVWSKSPTGDVSPESIKVVIKNADVGSSTFQIAFFFDGYTWNINNWYIDEISIAVQLPNVWIGITSDWHTPSNWGSGVVPDEYDVIVIPSVPSGGNFPVVTSNAECYDITLETGATIQVVAPAVLTVKSGQP
ncbi:MAG: fibronectin type III domain-containing protein [Bacteroidales bacterium]|nr:fibronectin type III domain-containing protein [Bacteroidales bacterium]